MRASLHSFADIAMPRPHRLVLALGVFLAAGSLSAQGFAPGSPVTMGAVRFSVPSPYTAVRELSDSNSRVFHDSASRTWVLVASLRRAEDRPAVIRSLLRRFGSEVLGGDPDTLDWQLAPDFPNNLAFQFHQRLEAMGGPQLLDITLVQLRSGGTDVLVGSAFIAGEEARSMRCGEWVSVIALDAQYWVIDSLLGREHKPRTPFEGSTGLVLWAGPPNEPSREPAHPDATRLIALYDAYEAANREHRRATLADLVTPAVFEYYGDVRRLALYATPSEVRALPAFQRLQVLMVRKRFDAARLAGLDLRELLTISIEGRDGLSAGVPMIHGDVGWMNLQMGSRWTPFGMGFLRADGGGWSIDPLPLLAMEGCLLRASLRRNGVSRAQEDSALVQRVAEAGDRRPLDEIWQPLVRAGARPD